MKTKTQKITLTAMFCALAYVAVAVGRIPAVEFLKYDPKDIVITLGGLILGPVAALVISVITSFIEMITISDTGPIGLIMNIISSCSFSCTAALIYKKNRTLKGAGIGLVSGCAAMVAVMMLWNYCITPIYMEIEREVVAKMLPTVFLPFNAVKGALNAAFTFLLYKPVVQSLRRAGLLTSGGSEKSKANIPMICISALIIVTCVLLILSFNGTI